MNDDIAGTLSKASLLIGTAAEQGKVLIVIQQADTHSVFPLSVDEALEIRALLDQCILTVQTHGQQPS